ncbi:MAG: hypothetical protein JNJ58_13710 [Chitinophagaceae bacterium]|nr:hypothetical protein [Chitinophagaceae bacterium]
MLELNPEEITYIYDTVLYESVPEKHDYKTIQHKNGNRIAIFLLEKEFSTEDHTLLKKMMGASQLHEEAYSIIALTQVSDLMAVLVKWHPETVILFGLTLQSPIFQLNRELYKPFRFNQMRILLAESLPKLAKDDSAKKQLWNNGLKPLFNIQ